jgi:hypothetical protein
MSKDTGGPAFPCAEWLDTLDPEAVNPIRHQGMTLRDYFAAKVMQGILASSAPITSAIDVDQLVAAAAYKIADAMLKAREA